MLLSIFQNHALELNDSSLVALKTQLKNTTKQEAKGELHFKIAAYFSDKNKSDSAFYNILKAQTYFKKIKNKKKEATCNLELFKLIRGQNKYKSLKAKTFLDKYYNYVIKQKDTNMLIQAYKSYASLNFDSINYNKAKHYYTKSLQLARQTNDSKKQQQISSNMGLLYSSFISQDSARIYLGNAITLSKLIKNNYTLCINYINYANSFQKENNYASAINYLKKADSIQLKKHNLSIKKVIYRKLANCYANENNYKKAFNFKEKYEKFKDSINYNKQNIAISKIKEQYDNEL